MDVKIDYNNLFGLNNLDVNKKQNKNEKINEKINKGINPLVIVILAVVIILYYLVASFLSSSGNDSSGDYSSGGVGFLEVILWCIFIVVILLTGLRYLFEIDVTTYITDLFSENPNVVVEVNDEEEETLEKDEETLEKDEETLEKDEETLEKDENKIDNNLSGVFKPSEDSYISKKPNLNLIEQVFYVNDNKYTYSDAKAICKAYGGRLADYNEMEKAYQSGAEWCGYGWSKDQLALYPTQLATYEKLKTDKKRKHACGRPGINGGYISNPNVRFGVNCFGVKPKMTPSDEKAMELSGEPPKTKEDLIFDKKVEYWKTQLPYLSVAPYNKNTW